MQPRFTRRSSDRHLTFLAALSGLACLGTLLAGLAAPLHAAGRPEVHIAGQAVVGDPGIPRTMAEIMREEALHAGEHPEPAPVHEFELPDLERLMNPESPRVASVPGMPTEKLTYRRMLEGKILLPNTPQTVGLNFIGATLSGTNRTSAYPPDCDGAVGPTQYVIAVNGRIVTFNKTTGVADGVMNTTTNTFFSSVRSTSGTSDPNCRYDRLSGRWFIGMINTSSSNRYMLAVSDAASNGVITASTVWTFYYVVPSTLSPTLGSGILSDYPTMGVDANALYTGFDEFNNSSGAFVQVDALVIKKSSVLSGGPIVATAFRNLMSGPTYVGPFAPRGVDGLDATQTEGYMIGTDGASWGTLWLMRFANPGSSTPTMTMASYALPTEDGPRFVNHKGNTGGWWGSLDPLDDRFYQATIRGQQLWTVHNLGVDSAGVSEGVYNADARDGARWFQFNVPVGSGAPTIVQSGTVFTASAANDSLQRNYFIPSVAVSGQGHAAMAFSTAGANEYANCGTVGRLASDPAGTMEAPLLLTSSASAYNPTGDGTGQSAGRPHRWGDFSTTVVDPLDDQSMWTVQMWCNSANSYACQIAKLVAPPPATPSALADLVAGQSSVSVTLTGTSAAGSGFFDPGADLPSPARPFTHISATCSNGAATGTPPSVVSVTYVNPTTLTVVLNTSSASANLPGQMYSINVTNPDGQSVAGAVVHVIYTITASAGANGSIVPPGITDLASGGSQHYSIAPATGYHVADVQVDNVSVGPDTAYDFTSVTANHTISASFAINTYSITATHGPNGSVTPAGVTMVNYGGSQHYVIAASPPYHVMDVKVDSVSIGAVGAYDFTNVTANHTIFASFAIDSFTITATAGPHGAIAPAGVTSVSSGGGQSYTITPDAGYGIQDVQVDSVSVGATPTYNFTNVTANHTIAAQFKDTAAPTVAVTAPNGGEHWAIGSTQSITWTASDNVAVDSVNADYSVNGAGGPWMVIQHGMGNSGSYSWLVTGPATDSAVVRVTAFDHALNQGSDASDSLFHVTNVTGVGPGTGGPAPFALYRPVPNPSSEEVTLRFSLSRGGSAEIEILAVNGAVVWRSSLTGLASGQHSVTWGGRTQAGDRASNGIYFVLLRSGGQARKSMMVRLR